LIKKMHVPPIKILKLYALLRRIIPNHPLKHDIEAELMKLEAGYKGEVSLDYHLSFLPETEYLVLHNLRLSYKTFFFQIDTLILHTNFILILEVKNIAGEIYIDTHFNQLIRTRGGHSEIFPDPILQAYKQRDKLHNWLMSKNFPSMPIEYRVILTNSRTFIKNTSQDQLVHNQLIRSERLVEVIKNLTTKYQKQIMTTKEMNKIANRLIKFHIPQDSDVLSQFRLSKVELQPGVYCTKCHSLSMERSNGTWKCSICLIKQKDAHINALCDYALLIDNTISNKELRSFTKLTSLSTAARLLSLLDLPYTGTTKDRRYFITPLIPDYS
jgi:ribosomal protein L37AE/L43A